MRDIGFVGLGAMGAPMAARLARDPRFVVAAFDTRATKVDGLADYGGRAATSAADAADSADVLILMVANFDQVRAALFGRDGAAPRLRRGSTTIVMSTIGPAAVAEIEDRLRAQGVSVLDAPVSGGPTRAAAGELLILAGGPSTVFADLEPVLAVMGTSLVHCGESVGDGQAVKLVNQLLCGVHVAVAAEAVAFAEALSLDPRLVLGAIGRGAAQSYMLDDRGARMLDSEFVPARSALGILVKDLGLVCDAADAAGFAAMLAERAREMFEEGAKLGLAAEDDSGLVRVLRRPSVSSA